MKAFTKFCLFIYLSLLIPKNVLVSCSDSAQGTSWTPGNNHVDIDLNKKVSTNEIDYEKKADAHVFTTKDGYFIAQVVISGTDAAGQAKTNVVTKPNNQDARRVILYTIAGKGPQLEVIYAADLATNNAKFQTAVDAGKPYGPDAPADSTSTTPPSESAPPATPAAPEPEETAPDASSQPMAEATPAAESDPAQAAPVAEPTESSSADGSQVWTASAPPQDQSLSSAPEAHAAPAPRVAPQQASAGLAGALGGSFVAHPPQVISAPADGTLQVDPTTGRTYADFTLEEDENEKEGGASASGSGFEVREVHSGDPNSMHYDSDEEDYDVHAGGSKFTTYVHTLGHRVSNLELRMEPLEDKVDFLTKITQYQHELMVVNNLFKSSDVFKAGMAHGMAPSAFMGGEAPVFRPATHEGSRVLDHSEFPSDLKLYVADPNDATKLVELGHDKLTVKTEHNEVLYQLAEGVQLLWVTLLGKTVWFHREADPHPLTVVFYPADAKVILDFADAIYMYVRKPEEHEAPAQEDITLSHAVPEADHASATPADAHAEGAAEGAADAGLAASHGTQEADANGHSAPVAGSDATPANETASSVVF